MYINNQHDNPYGIVFNSIVTTATTFEKDYCYCYLRVPIPSQYSIPENQPETTHLSSLNNWALIRIYDLT